MIRQNKKQLILTYFFICMILIGGYIIISDVKVNRHNIMVILTFGMNGIIILSQIFKESKLGYSLKDIIFIFLSVFMFIAPLIQYLSNSFPWSDANYITDDIVIYTNVIILIFIVTFLLVYEVKYSNSKLRLNNVYQINNIKLVLKIFSILSVFCSLYIIAKTGIVNLFARSTNILEVQSSSISLIISNTFRAIPVLTVALNLVYKRVKGVIYNRFLFVIIVILMLLVNFPTATARFWMAAVYIGLLLMLKRKFKNKLIFKILIYGSLIYIFPLVNAFRNSSFLEVISNGIVIPDTSQAFTLGDFDAFSMLARSIIYVDNVGSTFGHQLLGNLLFFIPRSIWPLKPVGSGVVIAEYFGWDFTNVSCPYIAEGYINFGLIGVIIFSIVLAIITKNADKKFEFVINNNEKKCTFIEIVYAFSVGFLFFILRGDLLSSLSYYIGFVIPIIGIFFLQKIKFKIK